MSQTTPDSGQPSLVLPQPSAEHGHRKLSFGLGTFAAGEIFGKDVLIWLWGMLARWQPEYVDSMPEVVASQLVFGAAFLAFYRTTESK